MKHCVWIAMAVLLSAMGGFAASLRIDGVAAYANAHVITVSDVLKTSRALQEQLAKGRGGPELDAAYKAAMDEVIGRKLILDDYENQKEIEIPDSAIDERANAIVRDMFGGDRAAFLEALAEDGLSEKAWREQIREQTIVGAMRNLRVDSKVSVSPLAVREAYDTNRVAYATQPKVSIRMIIIAKGDTDEAQVTQKAKMDAVVKALDEGGEFAELAIANSEDSRAADGGERGWLERDMLREDIAEVAFSIGIGKTSEALDIGKQFCILKVEDRVDAETIPFEEAQPRIERQLRIGLSQTLYETWINRLRQNGYVKTVDTSLTQ
jgi:peptidyl-prolyl cis-trans isomerase SurA